MSLAVPALVKVLLVFALILVANRLGLHLGLALMAGAVGLAFWFGYGFGDAVVAGLKGIVNPDAIILYVVILQIVLLSSLLESTGVMRTLLETVRSLIPSRRATIASLPALIGLLPMPGGAAFSAPMVDAADEDKVLEPVIKTAINYWFRHIWEYWWPLYPGALLAWELSGLSFLKFFAVQGPLTLFSVAAGTVFLLLPLHMGPKKERPKADPFGFLKAAIPIALVPLVSLAAGKIMKNGFGMEPGKYLPMVFGLCAALTWVQIAWHAEKRAWQNVLTGKKVYLLILVVAGVMAFSAALKAPVPTLVPSETGGEVRIVDQLLVNLNDWRLPAFLVVMVMPFISGFITGLAVGFVGTSFPIVMALVGDGALVSHTMAYVVLGYAFGYMGMMLSPVHICFLVTNEHFKTPMVQAYKKLVLPSACVLAGATLLAIVLNRLG